MNTEKLYEILQETTQVYRKGEPIKITRNKNTNLEVMEIFGYPHTSEASTQEKYEKVDMIFIDILVDKEKAKQLKNDLERILAQYPEPERLAGGPSYIELSPNLGLEQEAGLRLMALGKSLGLWDVVSGKTIGMNEEQTLELAGRGFLMISGYKPGARK